MWLQTKRLILFYSEDENSALRQRSVERDVSGKSVRYVECLARNKEVQLKPEEHVRQLWLSRLINTRFLADVLARIADYPVSRLVELLPWHWKATDLALAA